MKSNDLTHLIKTQLIKRGIKNRRVINAFRVIDRKDFVDQNLSAFIYHDTPLPIGLSQTISQPYIVAYMLESLDLKETDNALEIGTGSGYATALLACLTNHVTSIERLDDLSHLAKKNLSSYTFNHVSVLTSDGALGYLPNAPYDKILVSCASKSVPDALIDQLAVDGAMIIPLGNALFQTLTLIRKTSEGIKKTPLLGCRFVPLVSKTTSSF